MKNPCVIDASRLIRHLDLQKPVKFEFGSLNEAPLELLALVGELVVGAQTRPRPDGEHVVVVDVEAINFLVDASHREDGWDPVVQSFEAVIAHELYHAKQQERCGSMERANAAYERDGGWRFESEAERCGQQLAHLVTIHHCS